MAGQPNISSILASLAGPRQGQGGRSPYPVSIPPQNHSYPPQHMSPPGSAQPQPPYHNAPYHAPPPPIPQPNGSGMINLMDVRPIHSGSVNIAPPPIQSSYQMPMPMPMPMPLPVRSSYHPSRSRSRSPRRSTPDFRSHATYREDRPTSISNGGTHTETVMINSSCVGLVIGRQGENMRRLEADSRTRIQFAPAAEQSGKLRRCTITGSRAAIEVAIESINRTIEEHDKGQKVGSGRAPPPPGRNLSLEPSLSAAQKAGSRKEETTTIINVPSKTVGLVIGKGGESIKNLQDRSLCHINVMPEEATKNGMRPLHLIGTLQQAAAAQEMIMEIVNNDAKNLPGHGSNGRDGVNAMSLGVRGSGGSGQDKLTDSVVVPSEAVGMIIGKGGETVRDMQDITNCKINVSQPTGRDVEREIELIGSRAAIQHAKDAINEKVRAVQLKNRANERPQGGHSPSGQWERDVPRDGPQSQPQPYPYEVADPPGGHDVYAAYGGYQNYVALWYASTQGKQGEQTASPAPGPRPSAY